MNLKLFTRVPHSFLSVYDGATYLIRQKALALFWILTVSAVIFLIPLFINILTPLSDALPVVMIDIGVILVQALALMLVRRGRIWLAGDLVIMTYCALWLGGMALKMEGFTESGVNSFNYFIFAIIVFAAVFSRPRIVAGVTVLAIGAFTAQTVLAWQVIKGPAFYNLILSQSINIFIAAFGSGVLLFIIRRITDRSMAITEHELRRNRELTAGLESLVNERTQELMAERNELRCQKTIMDREMHLAARIQRQIIPAATPGENISFIYRPMEKVGGDFFDFLTFPGEQRQGIFLCDVSGHGVPAALITSMIKSFLLQFDGLKDEPARLITAINDQLHEMTAGNFVTAFYGVFDPVSRLLRFSNAGHFPPYLVREGSCTRLAVERSLPLAVYGKRDLAGLDKEYRTRELIIDAGSTMVLYTDGLVEAQDGSHRMFGDGIIDETLIRLSGTDGQLGAADIYQALARFTGSEHFEDDICIICLRA